MKMTSINESIRIGAPLERAMEALTTEAGYRGWWSKDCSIPRDVGGEPTLKFDKGGTIVAMRYRIDAIEPEGKVKWTCIGHDMPSWIGTSLNWNVVPSGDGVEVKLEHAGWQGDPPEPVTQGWRHFLGSMKAFLETGRGEPW
jgi:uncharacterized protein YndB with AHSA1/START domain